MKKIAITFLITALMVTTNASIVHADSIQATSKGTVEVSLTNIKDIMMNNSLDMQKAQNTLDGAQDAYDDAKDAYNEADEEYPNKVANIKAEIAALDPTSETYSKDRKNLESDLDTAKNDVDDAEAAKESKKYDLKSAEVQYNQSVEQAVYTAQQNYIKYLSTLADKKLQGDTASSNEEKLKVYKLQYDSGFLSKKEYDSYVLSTTESKNTLNEDKNAESIALQTLKNSLGISDDTELVFNNSIQKDIENVSKIDYNSDLEDMLNNNYDIQIQNINIDQLNDDDDTSDATIDNAEISLEQDKTNAELSFKTQYNTLMNSYNSIKSSYDSLSQEENAYNVMATQYSYGFISKSALSDKKLELDKQNSEFTSEQNQFYLDYLHYIQMKEGL